MIKYDLCIGKSKDETNWKNVSWTWEEFTAKLKKTTRTFEKIEEYLQFKKERQSEIKDVGGFVSGHTINKRRFITSIPAKQILTLDIDEAEKGFWESAELNFSFKMCIYTTHSHTVKNNRFRLLIPLTRELLKDEYEAVCRKIAQSMGIDQFDHTSYQMNRLMFWPSTAKDGIFYYKENDSEEILNPDTILSEYLDWQDISSWPLGKKEKEVKKAHGKEQGDPYEKPGLIGLFNKEYSISEAIEKFIPEAYQEAGKDRYTYLGGTTYAGAVCYDNKFLYSHHSTDPACNVLCNAFDLIRIHKFGLEDKDCKEDTPINKRPSFIKMSDLASQDKNIKRLIGETRLEKAKEVFALAEYEENWLERLDVDRKGNYLPTINNVALILDNDPAFKEAIRLDEFQGVCIVSKDLPWRKVDENNNILRDRDISNIESHIEKVYSINPTNKVLKGLDVVLEKNKFHPVVDYLNSLKWDGKKRIETLLVDCLGAEDSRYTRAVTKKCLTAAVARILKPGIKFDNVLTLVGEEGQGKSALWDLLGGAWFSDTFTLHMLSSNDAYEQIQGVWIIEIAELSGMARADIERVKGFISARKDRYRSPWGRAVEKRARQCIFVGSTNKFDFLRSQTGNRSFWPVATFVSTPKNPVHSLNQDDVNQIWAEAKYYFSKSEPLYLEPELVEIAKTIQEAYTEENPWVDIFKEYLEYSIPENWYNLSKFDKLNFIQEYSTMDKSNLVIRTKVCKYELWEIALNQKNTLDSINLQNIKSAMRKIKDWKVTNELVRFGTSYPRHKGSYEFIQKTEKRYPARVTLN